jgi:hypothetical protein
MRERVVRKTADRAVRMNPRTSIDEAFWAMLAVIDKALGRCGQACRDGRPT